MFVLVAPWVAAYLLLSEKSLSCLESFVSVSCFFFILDNGSSWDNYHSGKIFFLIIHLKTHMQFKNQQQIYCILELYYCLTLI